MIERVQYNAALAITGAILGTSQQKIYNELALESLRFRRWFRRLCVFYEIKIIQLPSYLHELVPKSDHNCSTRNFNHIDPYYCRTYLNIPFFHIQLLNGANLMLTLKMLSLACV